MIGLAPTRGERVVILYNPASGRGKSQFAVDACARSLRQLGLEPMPMAVGSGKGHATPRDIDLAAESARLLVLVGGDGTVHHTLPLAIRTRLPIYHVPFGTENLFAREFGMSPSIDRLVAAIRTWNVRTIDTATCNQRPFVLMASLGFDANIVARVAQARRGTVHRLHYVAHALRELFAPTFADVTAFADGQELFSKQRGVIVIANSRQYAARLDPAPTADMTDALLDIVYLPLASRLDFAALGLRALLNAHRSAPGVMVARASHVRLMSNAPVAIQLDGELARLAPTPSPGATDTAEQAIEFRVCPASLNVLCPP